MWTADDDAVLLRLVKAHNGNFQEVSLQMGRVREDCMHHYQLLLKHGVVDDGTMLQGRDLSGDVGMPKTKSLI